MVMSLKFLLRFEHTVAVVALGPYVNDRLSLDGLNKLLVINKLSCHYLLNDSSIYILNIKGQFNSDGHFFRKSGVILPALFSAR